MNGARARSEEVVLGVLVFPSEEVNLGSPSASRLDQLWMAGREAMQVVEGCRLPKLLPIFSSPSEDALSL